MRLHVEKRLDTPRWMRLVVPTAAVLLAFLFGALLISATGNSASTVYASMLRGTFGSWYAISETVVKAIPLMLTSLGVGVAMKMRLWNIGAAGQLLMGAFAATWLALTFRDLPPVVMLMALTGISFLAGGLWAVLAVLPRALWGISEIITTLMLNYVAALWIRYLVQGPWRDPLLVLYPFSSEFPPAAKFPVLGDTRIHLGIVFAVVIAAILLAVLTRTRWGYEIRTIGASPVAARYAGMNVLRNILVVMLISGGISGIAGMSELSGVFYRLQDNLAAGVGYTAIIIASLARGNPFGILVVAFLFAALQVGGTAAQTAGISASIAYMLQGAVLFFVLGGDFFLRYRVSRLARAGPSAQSSAPAGG
jgi:simple sugar transport system permease protein